MFILLRCTDGSFRIRKKSQVREVSNRLGDTVVYFEGKKNSPLTVEGTIQEIYSQLTEKNS
jgi:hypothetical protein